MSIARDVPGARGAAIEPAASLVKSTAFSKMKLVMFLAALANKSEQYIVQRRLGVLRPSQPTSHDPAHR
jgi:hypothetical protein